MSGSYGSCRRLDPGPGEPGKEPGNTASGVASTWMCTTPGRTASTASRNTSAPGGARSGESGRHAAGMARKGARRRVGKRLMPAAEGKNHAPSAVWGLPADLALLRGVDLLRLTAEEERLHV